MSVRRPARPEVAAAQRTVIKVGTRVLSQADGGLSLVRLFNVVEQVAALRAAGREVLLVSSGAVGLGRDALGLRATPTLLTRRQACAAVGQGRLMGLYEEGFGRLGVLCAQVLLTRADFSDRTRYLSLRGALNELLQGGVVPIVNENDVVGAEEHEFVNGETRPITGDNDSLSAMVASKLDADLLLLLTDVDGVYDCDPTRHAEATLVRRIAHPEELSAELSDPTSGVGRGGMRSKVAAAFVAARSGCHAVIASGLSLGAPARVLAGDEEGTWFAALETLSARRRWIAFATATRGTLELDAGAVEAVAQRNGSVLPAGVVRSEGCFARGDVVELRGPEGELVGRGIIQVDADKVQQWIERAPRNKRPSHNRLIHGDELVLAGTRRSPGS